MGLVITGLELFRYPTPSIMDIFFSELRYFVVLFGKGFRTMDNMMALNKSVNLIINVKNIEDIGKILSRSITDNEYFYRVFKESLKEVGKV